jgi:hypothetical protein
LLEILSENDYTPNGKFMCCAVLPRFNFADSVKIAERTEAKLFDDEITGDCSTLRAEPLRGCDVVVDMRSGAGSVR